MQYITAPFRSRGRARTNEEAGPVHKIDLGICAMASKIESAPMEEILRRITKAGEFRIVKFPEEVILEKDVSEWPKVHCLIAFFSTGFPLDKAIDYVRKFKPITLNDLEHQKVLRSRLEVYRVLDEWSIPHPNYITVDHDAVRRGEKSFEEYYDYIVYEGIRLNKPFVEKPIDADDHNNWIYYPRNTGGGCKKLFRKVKDRSSNFDPELHQVRRDSMYIYEEFLPTYGTDVKVYTVGQTFAHAEARKAPSLDGRVQRSSDGKEVRYPVILSEEEKLIAYRIVEAFRQTVCGFDILRTKGGKPVICDVNGWSFVKGNVKYYNDCAHIIRGLLLSRVSDRYPYMSRNVNIDHAASAVNLKDEDGSWKQFLERDNEIFGNPEMEDEELRVVCVVMRHGDRQPKQKLKFETDNALIRKFFDGRPPKKEVKLKSPEELQLLLERVKAILQEVDSKKDKDSKDTSSSSSSKGADESPATPKPTPIPPPTKERESKVEAINPHTSAAASSAGAEELSGLRQLLNVLTETGSFTGINRKIQLKPIGWVEPAFSISTPTSGAATDATAVAPPVGEVDVSSGLNNIPAESASNPSSVPSTPHPHIGNKDEVAGFGFRDPSPTPPDGKPDKDKERGSSAPPFAQLKQEGGDEGAGKSDKKDRSTTKDKDKDGKDGKDGKEKDPDGSKKDKDKQLSVKRVLVVAKWGGELTEVGRAQAEDLGKRFRMTMYPGDSEGLLRLHSTFRHDFKIYTSDEGRCQVTSAAFTKGFLDLEGELTPILVQLVIRDGKAHALLDDTSPVEERGYVKEQIDQFLHNDVDLRLAPALLDEFAPSTFSLGLRENLLKIQNPLRSMKKVKGLIDQFTCQLGSELERWEPLLSCPEDKVAYCAQRAVMRLQEMQQRWRQLNKAWYIKPSKKKPPEPPPSDMDTSDRDEGESEQETGRIVRRGREPMEGGEQPDGPRGFVPLFDTSKVPDLVDNVRFDLIHHHPYLGNALDTALTIHSLIEPLGNYAQPQEYGVNNEQKLKIGASVVHKLLRKIVRDLTFWRDEDEKAKLTPDRYFRATAAANRPHSTSDTSAAASASHPSPTAPSNQPTPAPPAPPPPPAPAAATTPQLPRGSPVSRPPLPPQSRKPAMSPISAGKERGEEGDKGQFQVTELNARFTERAAAEVKYLAAHPEVASKLGTLNLQPCPSPLGSEPPSVPTSPSPTGHSGESFATGIPGGEPGSRAASPSPPPPCQRADQATDMGTAGRLPPSKVAESAAPPAGKDGGEGEVEGERDEEREQEKERDKEKEATVINTNELWGHQTTVSRRMTSGHSAEGEEHHEAHHHEEEHEDRNHIRLQEDAARALGIKSPWRNVRSRYYVTSASHLLSLVNVLLHSGGITPEVQPLLDGEAQKKLQHVTDLHYMSHVIFRLWENRKLPVGDPNRYRLEIQFSTGARDGFGENYALLARQARETRDQLPRLAQSLYKGSQGSPTPDSERGLSPLHSGQPWQQVQQTPMSDEEHLQQKEEFPQPQAVPVSVPCGPWPANMPAVRTESADMLTASPAKDVNPCDVLLETPTPPPPPPPPATEGGTASTSTNQQQHASGDVSPPEEIAPPLSDRSTHAHAMETDKWVENFKSVRNTLAGGLSPKMSDLGDLSQPLKDRKGSAPAIPPHPPLEQLTIEEAANENEEMAIQEGEHHTGENAIEEPTSTATEPPPSTATAPLAAEAIDATTPTTTPAVPSAFSWSIADALDRKRTWLAPMLDGGKTSKISRIGGMVGSTSSSCIRRELEKERLAQKSSKEKGSKKDKGGHHKDKKDKDKAKGIAADRSDKSDSGSVYDGQQQRLLVPPYCEVAPLVCLSKNLSVDQLENAFNKVLELYSPARPHEMTASRKPSLSWAGSSQPAD
ncbi:unnamed protein product [Vitrella brassicaformis CCMP3155]|uniref:Inositol hexakisphosphate and diphosphoinositol-pentakisphosphate kinase n=3 Tax=Vitrella brassicaformis TaxID=1169539 RepID=A0A0G4G1P1_VITBC|nr:unnamed protein product [Vitrella brassicaformis CCMP3155]|eukprot:CEM21967.1 unnamed protein product [Vitrella brassicaformis CCMP3155]